MNESLLAVENLTVERGGRTIVHGVSFSICQGETVLIIGHNGSGKSTLLLAIAGLIPIRSGTMRWASKKRRRSQSILLQDSSVFLSRSVTENVAAGVFGRLKPGAHLMASLEQTISSQFPELREKLHQSCGTLSGGQRRLVGIARTQLTDANIFLLDEPTLGLGAGVGDRVLGTLREHLTTEGRAAIVVEHNVQVVAPFATRLCVMKNGRFVYDGDPALLGDHDKLRSIYL